MGRAIRNYAVQNIAYVVKMSKQKNIALFIGMLLVVVLISTTVSAQLCNTGNMKSTLRKALFDYLPNPGASNLDADEIKDFLDFYLNTENLN